MGAPLPPSALTARSPRPTHRACCTQEREGTSGREGADPLARLTVPTTAMAKGLGSGGSATLQRSKLSFKQEVRERGPQLDDGMGGGGIGKGLFNGGGGEGDGGDDDDWHGDFGELFTWAPQ